MEFVRCFPVLSGKEKKKEKKREGEREKETEPFVNARYDSERKTMYPAVGINVNGFGF